MHIDDRLANWGRVMRVRPYRRRTPSLEGNYRSPQRNHWEAPVQTIPLWHDVHDAYLIEHAWQTLSARHRLVLKGHYCTNLAPEAIRRIVRRNTRRRVESYQLELYEAQGAISLAVLRTDRQNRNLVRRWVRQVLDSMAGFPAKYAPSPEAFR